MAPNPGRGAFRSFFWIQVTDRVAIHLFTQGHWRFGGASPIVLAGTASPAAHVAQPCASNVMTEAQVKQSNPADVRDPDIASYTNAVDEYRSRRDRRPLAGDSDAPLIFVIPC
jgi:hypothetical protein